MFFFSLQKLIFYQEHCQILFLIHFTKKSEGKETWNFWQKLWTNPFAKNANFSTSKYQLICSVENFAKESEGKETKNFWSKLWTNPFAKIANYSTSKYQLICSVENFAKESEGKET